MQSSAKSIFFVSFKNLLFNFITISASKLEPISLLALFSSMLRLQTSLIFKIKQEANIAIEEKRASKEIGSSLEAELNITTDNKNFELLEGLDLAEYFITSKAEKFKSKDKEELIIKVTKTKGTKCPRCWKILESKCVRCEKAITENI